MPHEIDAAFTALYEQTWKRVYVHILARCAQTHDAEDIFQETYLELYRLMKRRGTDYIKNGEAVVMKLAGQRLFRYCSLREKLRTILPLTRTSVEDEDEIELDDAALEELSAEEVAVANLTLEAAREYLDACGEETRRIFLLRFGLDLSIPEIAEQLGISRCRVKNRLYRTLQEMKRCLGE